MKLVAILYIFIAVVSLDPLWIVGYPDFSEAARFFTALGVILCLFYDTCVFIRKERG